MRWRGSVGTWIYEVRVVSLTRLQYFDLLMVVPKPCASGWAQSKNAELRDA